MVHNQREFLFKNIGKSRELRIFGQNIYPEEQTKIVTWSWMIDALWRTVGCTVAHSGLHCGAHWVALWRTVGYTVAHSGLHLSKFTIDTENPNFLILAKIVNIYKIYKCLEERRLTAGLMNRKLFG